MTFGLLASVTSSEELKRRLSEGCSLEKETPAALCCLQSVIKRVGRFGSAQVNGGR